MTDPLHKLSTKLFGRLPQTSTAPFCPAEIRETVPVELTAPLWTRFRRYAGLGFLVSVGYMDPGNWATDIQAGSRFGYSLLFVILLSSLTAMLLQSLCVRLGVASGRDIAQLCRERFSPAINGFLWFFAQLAIIACDFAEVLGTALALQLLFGLPIQIGVLLTALDTIIVLWLQGRGVVQVEAIITGLVCLIGGAFFIEILLSQPQWAEVAQGLKPDLSILKDNGALLIAIGILGATVMPHNLYLHSNVVSTRKLVPGEAAKADAIKLLTVDTLATLSLAFLVNAAILILAASAFHYTGHGEVTSIADAHQLLAPILGTGLASILFAVALFASGQSSTFTATMAGQIILQGFLKLRIPCWQQRFLTRMSAVVPAFLLISWKGPQGIDELLVLSQVVLSLQLPFAVVPLILFNRNAQLMGQWRLSAPLTVLCWLICSVIISANLFLLWQIAVG